MQEDSSELAFSAGMTSQAAEFQPPPADEADHALVWLDSAHGSSLPDVLTHHFDEGDILPISNKVSYPQIGIIAIMACLSMAWRQMVRSKCATCNHTVPLPRSRHLLSQECAKGVDMCHKFRQFC